ncbi:RNA 2',3'-cyclic phosphodiesterase [candidate division WOR-3 bacterium]|uniref:RNA 2',3'-cyclic phosphodiesterase n=1 Tax=candidate division WOR-3 bacterium TaxID=2052148 RepID=A0A660SJ51_UNCW3|nr:MAG: RNA 2',3'-cyclic phosphodiesterase [candidate division WOR-3 bacterium]
MRSFIAIPIPEGVRRSVSSYIHKVRSQLSGVKWVREENLHITLRFLGEIDEKLKEEVEAIIQEKSQPFKPFLCRLEGIGYFPSHRRARVIWIGIEEGGQELIRIFEALEPELNRLGFKREKPFHPHLTIGRVKSPRPLDLPRFERESFTANRIVLYKSTLTPEGPIYEPIRSVKLG